jgi:hypothetical protein
MKKAALLLPFLLVGCIHEPASRPHTGMMATPPPPAALVASCQSARTWHNWWVLSGALFSGLGGSGATVSAVSQNMDHTEQTALNVSVAVAAVYGGLAGAAAGITADSYSQNNCPAVLQAYADSLATPTVTTVTLPPP